MPLHRRHRGARRRDENPQQHGRLQPAALTAARFTLPQPLRPRRNRYRSLLAGEQVPRSRDDADRLSHAVVRLQPVVQVVITESSGAGRPQPARPALRI
ncbi:hypothetical protein M514_13534 [Trichuris suis]|uniref:Uncharacterized protein n=1 Tax=Trichuris suis TaxID=68888 RepID=A0A085MRZ1_9BILA|nr:hypothetical protein M514_13534 [Trichuris suis]